MVFMNISKDLPCIKVCSIFIVKLCQYLYLQVDLAFLVPNLMYSLSSNHWNMTMRCLSLIVTDTVTLTDIILLWNLDMDCPFQLETLLLTPDIDLFMYNKEDRQLLIMTTRPAIVLEGNSNVDTLKNVIFNQMLPVTCVKVCSICVHNHF